MNLSKHPPRSAGERFAGVVGLGRTTDKARAFLAGTLADYHFGADCPHDRAVFHVLAIDREQFLSQVKQSDDAALEACLRETYISKLSRTTVDEWNASFLKIGPGFVMTMLPTDHPLHTITEEAYQAFRVRIAPDRPDIRTFVDLLDFEDGRIVDHHTTRAAR